MKQVLIQQGGVVVEEVPAPRLEAGMIAVRVGYSCISAGTEMSGVRQSSLPLWKRAMRNPDEVRKVIDHVRSTGLAKTRDVMRRKLATAYPLGYSAAGEVIGVGAGVTAFKLGDRVACAGSQWSPHAEVVVVPVNLAARLPEQVGFAEGATTTLGAIALQGVRRAAPTFGETFVVLGLGIVGQLTARLLQASGVRVVGLDLNQRRIDLAMAAGMDHGANASGADAESLVYRLTDGYGADGVIVTAASASNDVIATAFKCCRKKARVVLVGDVGLDLRREDIYAKELDFMVSCSYGPGRYDRRFEEQGYDYPLPYVRWTETRNMEAYLSALASGRVAVSDLVTTVAEVEDAPSAYSALNAQDASDLAVLLKYEAAASLTYAQAARTISYARSGATKTGAIGLALVGAGGFAVSTLLPILAAKRERFKLQTVVTRNGVSARNVARQFDFAGGSTDVDSVLDDPAIDAVLVATRHDLHGSLALSALRAGKHVFVEKPLCLTEEELVEIEAFYASHAGDAPVLQTGFNRRFSRYSREIVEKIRSRATPLIVSYRVNAGYVPRDHWVHGDEGGGRNLGEACHFYDFFTALTGSPVTTIQAKGVEPAGAHDGARDNFAAQIGFEDGSVASLVYTALGASGHPKERFEAYVDGRVFSVDDYREFSCSDGASFKTSTPEKGHAEELDAFAKAILQGGEWPIPLWQQAQATRIALAVDAQLKASERGRND